MLDEVRAISNIVAEAKEDVVQWRIESALSRIKDGEAALRKLDKIQNTRAFGLVGKKLAVVKTSLVDGSTDLAMNLVQVDQSGMYVTIRRTSEGIKKIELPTILSVLAELDSLEPWLDRLSRKLTQSLFWPLMRSKHDITVNYNSESVSVSEGSSDPDILYLLEGLERICDFFAQNLPSPAHERLSQKIMPAIVDRLEDQQLHASVPISTDEMHGFEKVLAKVTHLAQKLDQIEWHGAKQLHAWVEGAPRIWLSRRREHALGGIRQLLFAGLRERKVVERVETHTISTSDVVTSHESAEGEEAWDEEWTEEPNTVISKPSIGESKVEQGADDEDASAWGAEFEDEQPEPSLALAPEGDQQIEVGKDDDEAWGWGEEEQSPIANKSNVSDKSTTKSPNGNAEHGSLPQELTLKETYTVTAVPEGVLNIVLQIFDDAKTLSDPR